MMLPCLGDTVPDFEAETTQGRIRFHKYIEGSWALLFSHPADFTPVCTTELAEAVQLQKEFERRNVKIIAISCDTVERHRSWIPDIEAWARREPFSRSSKLNFPIISDPDRKIASKMGILDPETKDSSGSALACRAVLLIDPNKHIQHYNLYPIFCGRNFHECLRVVDAVQLSTRYPVLTPANWRQGMQCVVHPSLPPANISTELPYGTELVEMPSSLKYMRLTPQPDLSVPETSSCCDGITHSDDDEGDQLTARSDVSIALASLINQAVTASGLAELRSAARHA